jgi:hypothetical protein
MSDDKISMYDGENKYFVGSSLLFMIPGFYGLYHKEYYLAPSIIAGSLISMNYWRDPKLGLRRNMDFFYVNGIAPYYIMHIFLIPSLTSQLLLSSLYGTGAMLFRKAYNEYHKKNRFWYIYHLAMHSMIYTGHSLLLHWSIFPPIS